MQITIDHTAGYCTGVERSIRIAEEELERKGKLYCLGDIIHNEQEMERLRQKGLQVIDHKTFRELKNARVLIRAHGEPPETFALATQNNIVLIDATCRVVANLQRKLREGYDQAPDEQQIVILGKKDHPEIIGLEGQIPSEALVIEDEAGIRKIDFRKPVSLYTQTTCSPGKYESITKKMRERSVELPERERGNLVFHNTICRQVLNRERSLRVFSGEQDVILFVSDTKSSNGRYLFGVCRETNPKSHFITGPEDMQARWFEGSQSVGITGATSTPEWLMRKVAEKTTEIVSSLQD